MTNGTPVSGVPFSIEPGRRGPRDSPRERLPIYIRQLGKTQIDWADGAASAPPTSSPAWAGAQGPALVQVLCPGCLGREPTNPWRFELRAAWAIPFLSSCLRPA